MQIRAQANLSIALVAAIAAALLVRNLADLLTTGFLPGYDGMAYVAAARAVAAGASPIGAYSDPWLPELGAMAPGYLYPPLLAVLLTPLARAPLLLAVQIWLAVVLASTVALAILLRRWLPGPVAVLAVLLCWPAWQSLHLGQINALVGCLWALALARPSRSGPWLALGAGLKLTPGLGVLALAARREWRPVVIAAGVGLGVVAMTLPLVGMGAWIDGVTKAARVPLDAVWTRSPVGLLEAMGYGPASVALALAVVAVTLWAAPRVSAERAIAGACLATMLAARATWPMHGVSALPVLAVLWAASGWRRGVAVAAWLALSIDGPGMIPVAIGATWVACFYVPMRYIHATGETPAS